MYSCSIVSNLNALRKNNNNYFHAACLFSICVPGWFIWPGHYMILKYGQIIFVVPNRFTIAFTTHVWSIVFMLLISNAYNRTNPFTSIPIDIVNWVQIASFSCPSYNVIDINENCIGSDASIKFIISTKHWRTYQMSYKHMRQLTSYSG